MEDNNRADSAAQQILKQLESLQKEAMHLSTIIEALKELFAAQAALKEKIPPTDFTDLTIDPVSYAQGSPILATTEFRLDQTLFRESVASVLPAMKRGFPKVVDQLDAVQAALLIEDGMSPEILDALASGNKMNTQTVAGKLNVDSQILETAMVQILKPFAQQRSQSLPTLPETLQWAKGYCPICGSWPELSFLEGKEGFRWLRCSLCGHEWKYLRNTMPLLRER